MLKPREVINQCYILQERAGEDVFCEIWRATALYSATQFTLRFFKERKGLEEVIDAFRAVTLATYHVSNPAVLDFVEFERFQGRGFIASEFGGERPLSFLPPPVVSFRLEHIARFIIELAQGLDSFHGLGLIYRSLSTEDILVSLSAGTVESIRIQKPGYGPLLALLDEDESQRVLGYVAPEARGEQSGDVRSDIYSIGVHLVRFVTGALPYPPNAPFREGASASLPFVAAAFLRRGVPEPVAAVALRALRRNPTLRFQSCIELIAALREFVDERRKEYLKSGRGDPLAELEALNRGKKVGAAEAMRSLDTADYFRALSEAPPAPPPPRPAITFPAEDFVDPGAVERLERKELDAPPDDDARSVEDYLAEARMVLSNESGTERRSLAGSPRPSKAATIPSEREPKQVAIEPSIVSAAPETPPPTLPTPPPPKAPPPVRTLETTSEERQIPAAAGNDALPRKTVSILSPSEVDAAALALSERELPLPEVAPTPSSTTLEGGEPVIHEVAADKAPGRKRPKAPALVSVGIAWRRESAPTVQVIEGMELAFQRAFRGKGAFRFIEEPRTGVAALAVTKALERFRAEGCILDLGALPRQADATDLIRALRGKLGAALAMETTASLRGLSRRTAKADVTGAFAAAPLGAFLYGANAEEPDPDLVERPDSAVPIAKALAAFGRRRRPLVLVIRSGETLGPSAHGILLELARLVATAPVCGFVFYHPTTLPAWHILSKF